MEWVVNRQEIKPEIREDFFVLGSLSDDKLLAAWLYVPRTRYAVEVIVESNSPRWASKDGVYKLLYYPFFKKGYKVIWAHIKCENKRAIQFIDWMGFKLQKTKNGIRYYTFSREQFLRRFV